MKANRDLLHSLAKIVRCLSICVAIPLLLAYALPVMALTPATSNGITGPSNAVFRAGLWWDPALSGSGWEINQSGDAVFGIWYTYDEGGDPVWYTTSGPLSEGHYAGDLLVFSWDYDSQTVNPPAIAGHVSIDFLNPQLAEIILENPRDIIVR